VVGDTGTLADAEIAPTVTQAAAVAPIPQEINWFIVSLLHQRGDEVTMGPQDEALMNIR
jgi:hypothetical protein